MKVTLIHPSINRKKAMGRFGVFLPPVLPSGIAYIASVLENSGISVKVVDDYAEDIGLSGILEKVIDEKPDLVGITCITPSAPYVYELAKAIKEVDRNTRVIIGNTHASFFAVEILKQQIADVIVHNEGEYTMLDLVKAIGDGTDLRKVEGISFVEDGNAVHTPARPFIENLDELPFPAWHLFPLHRYRMPPFISSKQPSMPIVATRGCPYRCTFCSSWFMGHKYRKRSPTNIVDEIEYLADKYKVKEIDFTDSIFPLDREHGMNVCDEIIARGLDRWIVWTSETRVDLVDKELLQRMKDAGCRRILYGFESGVEETLRSMKKGTTLQDAKNAMKITRESGIETMGLFMIGFPWETKAKIRGTIKFAKEIDPDFVKFNLTVPFPGTELYNVLSREGKLRNYNWENYNAWHPEPDGLVYAPDGITPEELLGLQKRGHFEFYIRPKVILRQLLNIRTLRLRELLYGGYILLSDRVRSFMPTREN